MRYLTLVEVLELHKQVIAKSGGSRGIRDLRALDSAINQPKQTFGQTDLYPDLVSKVTALGYSMVLNHPFIDGNKRIGHAAMEAFSKLNGFIIEADINEQEKLMLNLAAGKVTRDDLKCWLENHLKVNEEFK